MSFVVQLLPVSVGGFGVREAFFSFYFHRIGQPIEDAVLLSLVAQALLMLFSLGLPSSLAQRHLSCQATAAIPLAADAICQDPLKPALESHGGNPTISYSRVVSSM